MYESDETEKWRHGNCEKNICDRDVCLHSVPSLSALSTMSMSSSRSSLSWRSWRSRCIKTGDFCSAGHELVQIPVSDRQRYLQRQQMREDQQVQQLYQHYEAPTIEESPVGPIVIECDCCSRIITEHEYYIGGCCLICDIDVCVDCFKNGQSYVDVVLKESRENDRCDEQQQQQHQQQHTCHNIERYNGHRPTYIGTGRVNYDDYPDPTTFQWSFTGSSTNENTTLAPIEYFEKDFGKEVGLIQLDFYYTIGTVQTTVVDPVRGTVSDLFTKSRQKMSLQSYRKILKDPRSYNNERYKKGSSINREPDYYNGRQRQQVL